MTLLEGKTLVETYKEIIAELETMGGDMDAVFSQWGGKEAFYRKLQDIEDDAAYNQADIFKQAYLNGDIRRCARCVVNIAKNDWFLYKRGLRKVLYSEGNILKNPLNFSFQEDDYTKIKSIIVSAMKHIENLSLKENSCISKEMSNYCCKELAQLFLLYECFYENRIRNMEKINESNFLKLSLPQIFRSCLVFFQSQYNLAREEIASRWNSQDYVTGFESQVASEKASINPSVHVSIGDSFEQLLESMDTLFRYIFYLKGNEVISEEEIRKMDFATPYESPDYSTLDVLSMLDVLWGKMEAGFRYLKWNIEIRKNEYDDKVYCFYPSDEKAYKTHVAAGLRKKYNFMIEITNEKCNQMMGSQFIVENEDDGKSDLYHLPGNFYQEYAPVARRVDVNNWEGFHFERDEYCKLASYVKPIVFATKKRNKPYYFKVEFGQMNMVEYLDAYVFIYTLSKVLYCASIASREQEKLVPLISLDYIYNEYAAVSECERKKAKRLIDCFVFDRTVSQKKKNGDIFTNPLISVGSSMVLLSEGLISQMNLDRNIEVLLDRYNVKLAPVGKDLERKLVEKLQKVKNLKVNTKKIDFRAYDGKNAEFDFMAVLDDYLILVEMKSLLQPYDGDELYRRYKTILEGVDQVNRRVNVIKNDWKKIQELASIELPNEPYDEKHIIKIVCTDVFNFTGLKFNDVVITDYPTMVKYFTNPYIHGVVNMQNGETKIIKKKTLWLKSGKPSAEELIAYLYNPDTMECYMECLKPEWKYIPVFKGYQKIAFKDLALKEDPSIKLAQKYSINIK